MVDVVRSSVALALGAAVVVAAMAIAVSLFGPSQEAARPLFVPADDDPWMASEVPLERGAFSGDPPSAVHGVSDAGRAIVLRVDSAALRAAASATGMNTGAYAIEDPDEPTLFLLAYDAKSTVLGCTVDLALGDGPVFGGRDHDGDGLRDGFLVDPCHPEGHWDPYRLGEPVGSGHGGLDGLGVLPLTIRDGVLYIQDRIPYEAAVATAEGRDFALAT